MNKILKDNKILSLLEFSRCRGKKIPKFASVLAKNRNMSDDLLGHLTYEIREYQDNPSDYVDNATYVYKFLPNYLLKKALWSVPRKSLVSQNNTLAWMYLTTQMENIKKLNEIQASLVIPEFINYIRGCFGDVWGSWAEKGIMGETIH